MIMNIALLAAAAEASLPIPTWIGDLTTVGLIVLFGVALARNWLYTGGQVSNMMDAEKRVSELWKANAQVHQDNLTRLMEALEPVVAGNSAILRAVEEIQLEQKVQRMRTEGQGR